MNAVIRQGRQVRAIPQPWLLAALVLATVPLAFAARAQTSERSGEEVVNAVCAKCHATGEGGAPKIGDRDAWIPRIKRGLDDVVRSAIRGHQAMPARGGAANLTDNEIRNGVIYMFSKGAAPAQAPAPAKQGAMPPTGGSNHATAGGMDVFLGIVSAESLRAYPKDSPEARMHGGVPSGKGQYHVNISLYDSETGKPVQGAIVETRLEQPGFGTETKRLEAMAADSANSYGSYFSMVSHADYDIKVTITKPGSSKPAEAKFKYHTP
jgi:cytochrome c5